MNMAHVFLSNIKPYFARSVYPSLVTNVIAIYRMDVILGIVPLKQFNEVVMELTVTQLQGFWFVEIKRYPDLVI